MSREIDELLAEKAKLEDQNAYLIDQVKQLQRDNIVALRMLDVLIGHCVNGLEKVKTIYEEELGETKYGSN